MCVEITDAPQTLAEICINMGICCGYRAVAAREKISGVHVITKPYHNFNGSSSGPALEKRL